MPILQQFGAGYMPHVWSRVPHFPQENAEVAQLVERPLRKR